ncbi:MAG: hypothetical protein QM278_12005 [Pseudomonadota bacterium]|nr:hypothetical protein [Pseudomonadota bacterium]
MKKKTINIGSRLLEAFTKEQVAKLLDIVFSEGDVDRWQEGFRKTDPDIAATLASLLESEEGRNPPDTNGKTEKTARITMSEARLLERWRDLWGRWDGIIGEVGDEDGSYAVSEHHWEETYFDADSLANDLEPIAGEMLPLIDDVYALVAEPDLFLDALETLSEAIADYPEWMGVEYGDGCTLGKDTTRCVLKWGRLAVGEGPEAGAALLEMAHSLIATDKQVYLDSNACVSFFAELPAPCCREIYSCLAANPETYALQMVNSIWRRVGDLYEERFEPAKYLETCGRLLRENWKYGPPLIAAAVERGDYEQAERYLEETFASLFRRDDGKTWHPELSILKAFTSTFTFNYLRTDGEIISKLLATWADVSRRLGNPIRCAAAILQGAVHRNPEDWDTIVGEFRKLSDPSPREALRHLFVEWRDMAARGSLSYYRRSVDDGAEAWIHWLLEADLDRETKADWFRDKLGRWLEQLRLPFNGEEGAAAAVFKAQWAWLARLTKDVAGAEALAADYPNFFKTVLVADRDDKALLDKGRQGALRRLAPPVDLPMLLGIWADHLAAIVPDPSTARGSRYTEQADWMAALYEVSRSACNRLIARWRREHNRKTSLWRELRARQLPV